MQGLRSASSRRRDLSEALGSWIGRRDLRLHGVALLTLALTTAYLSVRLMFTLEGANPIAFWLLFSAELFTLITFALYTFDTWRLEISGGTDDPSACADIVIATYNEPIEVLEPTVLGATRVQGVGTVWVLDDGRRDWVEELCTRLGARYVTRPDNRHAKAGNINHALPLMTADLLLFLDADHVPQRNAISAMSGLFSDPRLAIVQSPHEFRNRDSAQQRSVDTHEQSLFFEVLLPGRARNQAAFWCGSAAMIRREALVAVGGVATETVSEDLHTTIRIQALGYSVAYVNRRLISGLGPHNLGDYLLQRDRWARGTLAVLTSRESPVFGRGWSPSQRLHYLNSFLHYFLGIQRMAFVTALLLVLVAGILPVGTFPLWILALALTNIAMMTIASLGLGRGRTGLGDGVGNSWLTAEVFIRALANLPLRRQSAFRVTPKAASDLSIGHRLNLLRVPVAATAVLLIGWAFRTYLQFAPPSWPQWTWPGELNITLYWIISAFTALEVSTLIYLLWREGSRHQARAGWRFDAHAPGMLAGTPAVVVDLHEQGLRCRTAAPIPSDDEVVPLTLTVEIAGVTRDVHGVLTVRRMSRPTHDTWEYAGSVEWLSERDRLDIIDYCYVELAGKGRQRVDHGL